MAHTAVEFPSEFRVADTAAPAANDNRLPPAVWITGLIVVAGVILWWFTRS